MPRGFVWAVYSTDAGDFFALRVDADYQLDASRGFALAEGLGLNVLPRAWLPRHVVGIDDIGNTIRARVGLLDAPLWTGAITTFDFERSDQTTGTATVISRRQERLKPAPPA
jgi:hypothetical protein